MVIFPKNWEEEGDLQGESALQEENILSEEKGGKTLIPEDITVQGGPDLEHAPILQEEDLLEETTTMVEKGVDDSYLLTEDEKEISRLKNSVPMEKNVLAGVRNLQGGKYLPSWKHLERDL